MAFPKKLKQLCTPAFLYFVLSMLGVLVSVVQNLGNSRRYSLGMLSTSVPSTFLVFIVQIIYILFWTWVLNLMCKDGHKEIAWFLVLIPFILLFLIMGSMMGDSSYEGFYQSLPAGVKGGPTKAPPFPTSGGTMTTPPGGGTMTTPPGGAPSGKVLPSSGPTRAPLFPPSGSTMTTPPGGAPGGTSGGARGGTSGGVPAPGGAKR